MDIFLLFTYMHICREKEREKERERERETDRLTDRQAETEISVNEKDDDQEKVFFPSVHCNLISASQRPHTCKKTL